MTAFESQLEIDSLDKLAEAARLATEAFGRRPWFRGHRNREWQLLPKVHRIAKQRGYSAHYESTISNKFKAHAPLRHRNCPRDDNWFGWLSLMRHYGLPTRLLDWTESMLVAAFFAVEGDSRDKPPAIWALDPYRLNACAVIGAVGGHEGAPLPQYNGVVELLAADAFDARTRHPGTYAVVPSETDLRMLVQHSAFTVHSFPGSPLEEHKQGEHILMKFAIAPGSVSSLRESLDRLGVNRFTLFPDIGTLAEGIEEHEKGPANTAVFLQEAKE